MAEPAIGTYGAVAVSVALLLRTTSLAAIEPDALLLAAIWCASRTAMAVIARALPYARGEGLATSFLGGSWVGVAIGGSIAALALGFLAYGGVGLLSVVVALGTGSLVALIALRRLGGYTGDVLGAAGVIGETVALLVAASSW
jgi:adenosylcobinamide-GDP ribazoletransferase